MATAGPLSVFLFSIRCSRWLRRVAGRLKRDVGLTAAAGELALRLARGSRLGGYALNTHHR